MVRVQGTLDRPLTLPLDAVEIRLPAGPVRLHFTFRGGPQPTLDQVLVRSGGQRLEIDHSEARWQGRSLAVGVDSTSHLLEALFEVLADPTIEAQAVPNDNLAIRFGGGVCVTVPRHARVVVNAAARGPASSLQLDAPLVVHFGGAGIRISHDQLRWLSRLARVQISRATLHPDGSVQLEAEGPRGLQGPVRSGMHRISARLSELIRSGPSFARLRRFLVVS